MATITVFQGGEIQRDAPNVVPIRPADFGRSGLGEGLQQLGEAGSQAADKLDQIADINARAEADRLTIEYNSLAEQISQRVKQTLGDGAEAAAEQGAADLESGAGKILQRASPRARNLLKPQFAARTIANRDQLLDHGFSEKVQAFDANSRAANDSDLDTAAKQPTDADAQPYIAQIADRNHRRATFFGKGSEWERAENTKYVSQFYKSRALKLANGPDGSATAAIEYATAHRADLTDDDYNAIVTSYNGNSIREMAKSLIQGAPLPSATTAEKPDGLRALSFDAMWSSWYVPHEGSRYTVDNNGYGVKYGINAKAHPGEDIQGMTEGRAKSIIKSQYWNKLGIDDLPPAVGAIAFDTAVIAGPDKAKQLLAESGGDPDKLMQLRKSFLASLSASDPKRYPPGTWDRRNRDLQALADRQGPSTGTNPLPIGADTDLTEFRRQVMARTDIGLALKSALIDEAESMRSDARQERSIQEDDAQRTLTQTVTALGDKFTDVKQLPQEAWLRASPATRQTFTEMAKSNQDNKPIPPDVMRDIGFLQTFSPEKLADPKVLAELGRRGVPAKKLNELSQQGGQAMGAIAGAKADPISRTTLESIARPAFEAAGYMLWTTESKGDKKKLDERKSEAYRQIQLMNYLNDSAQTWAVNNPGKKADDQTIRGWVANALRMNAKGIPEGIQNDSEIVIHMNPNDRRAIQQQLRSAGLPVTVANIAEYHRRYLLLRGR